MKLLQQCASTNQCTAFRDKEVPLPLIYDVLKTATYTSTAASADNVEFVVVRNKENIAKIADQCPKQSWLAHVPCMIVVINDSSKAKMLYGERTEQYCMQAVGAAAHLIMLQATEKDLATYAVRLFNDKAVRRIIEAPDEKKVEIMLALGYPKEKKSKEKPLDVGKATYFEKYGNKTT
mgnify:FL=1